jgi:hypothetical protein
VSDDTGTTLEHDPDSGCGGCPFCYERNDYGDLACSVDAHGWLDDDGEKPAPAWCPLRAGPVTVRAKEKR